MNGNSESSAPVSVLLATYIRENSEHLYAALTSIARQSLPPAELVVVLDGPVAPGHLAAIARATTENSAVRFTVMPIEKQQGLANALNVGLRYCSFDVVARMDSDDIAAPTRIEAQFAFLLDHPEINVLASWHSEFVSDPAVISAVKVAPPTHDEIARALKWRNVISHPTIMFRKARILGAGGYDPEVGLLEDYDLHLRLIADGARYACIQEPLVSVRTNDAQRARRSGFSYAMKEWRFRRRLYRTGILTFGEFAVTAVLYFLFRLWPARLKVHLYKFVRINRRREHKRFEGFSDLT